MNNKIKQTASLFLCVIILLSFCACSKTDSANLWENATYTSDTTLGQGKNTVELTIKAQDKSVTLTVLTDETNLGKALGDLEIIDGEEGPYGLYIKKVNGITADYDTDGTYWAFYKDGEMMQQGIDLTEFENGDKFELSREE